MAYQLVVKENLEAEKWGFASNLSMESRGSPNVGPTLQVPSAVICRVGRRLPSEGKGHTFESCRVRLRISGVLLRADSQFRGLLAAEEQDRPPACQDAHAADRTAVPPSAHPQTWPGHKT